MALGQISCSERETHAMDSNLTHSSRTSCFSRYELLMSVLLFCVYQPSQTLHYCHGFTWSRASCQIQAGPLLVCPGPPLTVFCSVTCIYVNDVTLHSWESTDRGEKRGDKEAVYSEIWIVESLEVLLLHWLHFIKVKIFAGQKRLIFFTETEK